MKRLDEASYELFFKHYYRRLWAYLLVVANGDSGNIEEALQNCFEKVVKHIRVFTNEGEFWAWLCVIARNAYWDSQRKQLRFNRIRKAIKHFLVGQADSEPFEHDTQLQRLDDALLLLNKNEQCLVRKKYFEGYTYRQIAEGLGLTEKAV